MADVGSTKPANLYGDQDGWIGLGGLPDPIYPNYFHEPSRPFLIYNVPRDDGSRPFLDLLDGGAESMEADWESDLDSYPLDRRFVIFPELRDMGTMGLFRGDPLDYIPPPPAAIDYSKDPAFVYYRRCVEELETWVALQWLPSVETMLGLVKIAHNSPSQINHEITSAAHTATWLTDVAHQKIWLLSVASAFMDEPITAIDIIHSTQDLSREAILYTKTLDALHRRLKFRGDAPPEDMPDELRRLWISALLVGRGIIHDTNNINSALAGFSDLTVSSAASGIPDMVRASVEKFIRMLEFISFADAHATSKTASKLLSNRAEKRSVNVILDDIPDLPLPFGMRFPVFRCIYELTLNSIKYSDSDKPPYLRMISDPNDRSLRHAAISGRIDGRMFHMTVEDNGVGIGDVERAMRDGERLRPDLADGTGRGLGTVRSIARSLGGDLHIESRVGIGTKATVSFDMSRIPDIAGSGPPWSGLGNGQNYGGFTTPPAHGLQGASALHLAAPTPWAGPSSALSMLAASACFMPAGRI